MSTAQHAGRILEAWRRADATALANEVEDALSACKLIHPVSSLEEEQRELLETVAQRFRFGQCAPQTDAGVALLRHLQARAAAA